MTTKLGHAESIQEKLDESYEKLTGGAKGGNGYIDLFLIHSPSAGPEKRVEQWRALEGMVNSGKVRSIGVSN